VANLSYDVAISHVAIAASLPSFVSRTEEGNVVSDCVLRSLEAPPKEIRYRPRPTLIDSNLCSLVYSVGVKRSGRWPAASQTGK